MNKPDFIQNSINEFTSCMLQYIEEAEHQDGDAYWDKFQEPEEFFDDLILYIRLMGPNTYMTRVLVVGPTGKARQTHVNQETIEPMVVDTGWPKYYTYKDGDFMLFNKDNLKWELAEEL